MYHLHTKRTDMNNCKEEWGQGMSPMNRRLVSPMDTSLVSPSPPNTHTHTHTHRVEQLKQQKATASPTNKQKTFPSK